ncbi:unnamed protein product [Paramecium octaurelia]|uniref:Uncharacterized protein n=1 Tax=Paramecium octaurelia TaxID=43137 RepID=A0A8S1XZE4_PAROT|nr:unnamed protein product [Paramecium octaurelia]
MIYVIHIQQKLLMENDVRESIILNCTAICGDGYIAGQELCDDRNSIEFYGCFNCTVLLLVIRSGLITFKVYAYYVKMDHNVQMFAKMVFQPQNQNNVTIEILRIMMDALILVKLKVIGNAHKKIILVCVIIRFTL